MKHLSLKHTPTSTAINPAMLFNPAVYLYTDAVTLLNISRSRPQVATTSSLYRRRTYARSSIILFHSCIEALLNFLLLRIAFKKMPNSLKKHLEKLPFEVKLSEVTRDCCGKNRIEESVVFQQLKELHELRNSFMHPKILTYPGKMKQNSDLKFIAIFGRKQKETLFPHSKLHKYFNYIDYWDAQKAKRISDRFFSWLNTNLENSGILALTSMMHIENLPKIKKVKGAEIIFKMDGDAAILFDKTALKLFASHFPKRGAIGVRKKVSQGPGETGTKRDVV